MGQRAECAGMNVGAVREPPLRCFGADRATTRVAPTVTSTPILAFPLDGGRKISTSLGKYSLFNVQYGLAQLVVFVDFAVDFAGAVNDGGVVPVAQQPAHVGGGKLQFVD